MQANQTPVIWTVIIATVILLVVGGFAYVKIGNALDDAPTQAEVDETINVAVNQAASDIVANLPTAPTAEEIAALTPVPYLTGPQAEDAMKAEALRLALKEMDDDDFLDELLYRLNEDIPGGYEDVDHTRDLRVVVRPMDEDETEVDLSSHNDERAYVTIEFLVYYLADSDEDECGKARFQVKYRVDDLDRDNNYEDAEVTDRDYLRLETNYGIEDRYCA